MERKKEREKQTPNVKMNESWLERERAREIVSVRERVLK